MRFLHSFVYKSERPWPNRRLKTAAIVGHTTPDTTRLWIRTGRLGRFRLILFRRDAVGREFLHCLREVPFAVERFPRGVRSFFFQVENWDHDSTRVLDIDELEADTEYGYALQLEGRGEPDRILLGHDRPHRLRTMPEARDAEVSFGFYSCHMPYEKTITGKTRVINMETWDCFERALERHRGNGLRFVLAGGDQMYTDGVDTLNIWRYLNKKMHKERGGRLLPDRDDMVSWYRDTYRGYWGFPVVQRVFSSQPVYMIWDDHEICDGWGSYYLKRKKKSEIDQVLPDLEKRGLNHKDGLELLERMFDAAKQVYIEYQHAHNPPTPTGECDYGYLVGDCAFYVLDGRGHRDIQPNSSSRILGAEQMKRFKRWLGRDDVRSRRFLFVVSAVPVLHMRTMMMSGDRLMQKFGLADDLRDAWEHRLHDSERRQLLSALFTAAERQKVSILSGDVHASAVFKMSDPKGRTLYQLTSSAITYSTPRLLAYAMGTFGVPDDGESPDGYRFERLALYTQSNFSIIRVDPARGRVTFQLYGFQYVDPPPEVDDEDQQAVPHSIAKILLDFIPIGA